MDEEKWITVEDGTGFRKRIKAEKLQTALNIYAELRKIAKRPNSGYTEEEAEKMFTLRIVKEDGTGSIIRYFGGGDRWQEF